MEKFILKYTQDDGETFWEVVQPFYYESAEAAIVHLMEKAREQKAAFERYGYELDKWRMIRAANHSYKNPIPSSVGSNFIFAGKSYCCYDFFKKIESSATHKEHWVENSPHIYTIEEYFRKFSSNQP